MKRQTLALSLYLLFIAITIMQVVDAALVAASWTPIKDLKDKHVQEIAKFAIAEQNRKFQSKLELDSIVEGESLVTKGTSYRLVLAVKGGDANQYEAVVYEAVDGYKALATFPPYHG